MALLKELFKTLLEILGWHEVWDAYDWIKQSRWGKQVLTAIGALLVGAVGYATKHPALIMGSGRNAYWMVSNAGCELDAA